jgi:hypothetical protein
VRYAVIDGSGNPENAEFVQAKRWLYSVVHLLKPQVKEIMGRNYAEPPLEYQFWAENPQDFIDRNKDKWYWRVMIVLIDWISDDTFREAVKNVEKKLGPAPETLRLENLHEGQCVQYLHIGDYNQVSVICDELYTTYLPAKDLKPNGYYHEIYLNDPDRTEPAKRRILIRQPVA